MENEKYTAVTHVNPTANSYKPKMTIVREMFNKDGPLWRLDYKTVDENLEILGNQKQLKNMYKL